jgi:hypothetical protein
MHIPLSYRPAYLRGGVITHDLKYFWLYIALCIICLVIAALLARVKLVSFPLNPLYWHYWVMANAETPPVIGDVFDRRRNYRLYVIFWALSVCFLIFSVLILIAVFIE